MRITSPKLRASATHVSACSDHPLSCTMTAGGIVRFFLGHATNPAHSTTIEGPGADGLGDLECIRFIGSTVYACGWNRQVYKFIQDSASPRISGAFSCISASIIKPLPPAPPDPNSAEFKEWLKFDQVVFWHVCGTSDSDVYAIGSECWHFNGQAWHQVFLPNTKVFSRLGSDRSPLIGFEALCTTDGLIVVTGHQGQVHFGRTPGSFVTVSVPASDAEVSGVAEFGTGVVVATRRHGLWSFGPDAGSFSPIEPHPPPELKPIEWIDACSEHLLVAGGKRRCYFQFDGSTWRKLGSPANE